MLMSLQQENRKLFIQNDQLWQRMLELIVGMEYIDTPIECMYAPILTIKLMT